MVEPKYKRILIKLSGEALAGERGVGIDIKTVQKMALEIKEVHDLGIEIALVSKQRLPCNKSLSLISVAAPFGTWKKSVLLSLVQALVLHTSQRIQRLLFVPLKLKQTQS